MKLLEWQKRVRECVEKRVAGDGLFLADGANSLEKRLAIYQNGIWIRLFGSLEEDFPLTERLLGKAIFRELVRDFLKTPRGYQADLGEVSPVFARFARSLRPEAGVQRALSLDLLAAEARGAPEASPGVAWIGLVPSARFLDLPARSHVVWRRRGEIRRARLLASERCLLACFVQAAPLPDLALRLEGSGASPEEVQSTVARWVARGLISQQESLD